MNRRQFNASLAALAGAASQPFMTARTAMAARAALPAVPPTTYAWAHLIVRAQNNASPAMLARHLNLDKAVADQLFGQLIQDGVLRAPGVAGVARAVAPLDPTGGSSTGSTLRKRLTEAWDALGTKDTETPLANQEDTALVCAQTVQEDATDARTEEPVQGSPERR